MSQMGDELHHRWTVCYPVLMREELCHILGNPCLYILQWGRKEEGKDLSWSYGYLMIIKGWHISSLFLFMYSLHDAILVYTFVL